MIHRLLFGQPGLTREQLGWRWYSRWLYTRINCWIHGIDWADYCEAFNVPPLKRR